MKNTFQDVSLREKKFIKTKVALMKSFISRLRTIKLEDISIKEVCKEVEVSEGTFFNYFPRKVDLIYYFHQLFAYKIIWLTKKSIKTTKHLSKIDAFFKTVSEQFQHPYLVYELISIILGEKERLQKQNIHPEEIAFAWPECPGIEKEIDLNELFEEFFLNMLSNAVKEKELPAKTEIKDVMINLFTILVGVPIALEIKQMNLLQQQFEKHLSRLWKALGRV